LPMRIRCYVITLVKRSEARDGRLARQSGATMRCGHLPCLKSL
jgi:hypothetical protein